MRLILVPYIVGATLGGRRRYCRGLLMINEDGSSEVVVSRCDSFMHMMLVMFHELAHLAAYRLVSNVVARNLIDGKIDKYLR